MKIDKKGGEVGMKIYLASSWKNENLVSIVADFFRYRGHEVDAFVDDSKGRYVFHWSEMLDSPDKSKSKLNAITFLKDKRSQKAFIEDKKWLDWCDICILILPSGRSAHLEAGYAKGQGKVLVIYSSIEFPAGEFDVMYGFADLLSIDLKEIEEFINKEK